MRARACAWLQVTVQGTTGSESTLPLVAYLLDEQESTSNIVTLTTAYMVSDVQDENQVRRKKEEERMRMSVLFATIARITASHARVRRLLLSCLFACH